MTTSTAVAEPKLLSLEQQAICERLSTLDTEDVSQRAQALLLLEGGSTQPEAAEQSGLSIGQIRYMVKRFKEKGLDMFPAELLNNQDNQPVTNEPEQVEEKVVEPQPVAVEKSPPEVDNSVTVSETAEVKQSKQIEEKAEQKPGKKQKRKKASKKRIKPQKPVKKKKSRRKRKKNKNKKG